MTTARRIALLLLAAALVGGPAGLVAAHEYDGDTVATMGYDSAEDRFFGRVGSMEDACEKRRVVKVQQQDGSEWDTVGRDRSDGEGRWSLDYTDAEGTFRVVVRPRMKVTIEHDHRCDRYASPGAEFGR